MSTPSLRATSRYGVIAAAGSVVFSPLLALAYFATADGASSVEEALLSAWIQPARDLAGGLVTFAPADGVYAVYTLVLAALFPAVVLAARATRSARPAQQRGAERWGWRLALTGYLLFSAGLAVVALLLLPLGPEAGIVNVAFLATMLPGLLVGLIGSTVLGIGLLRSGYRPQLTAWLLAFALPLWFLGSAGLGHNSLGMVPLFIAWAIAATSLERAGETAPGQSARVAAR